jgi:type VI secretion system secreted protein VgrG
MSISQSNRLIQISASFVRNDTIATDLHVTEAFSEPYFIYVTVLSENQAFKSQDVIGQKCGVTLNFNADAEPREFHGRVMALSLGGLEGNLRRYTLRLAPGFWFTRQARRHRIFENKTALDIIKQVLNGYGDFCTFENKTTATYVAREYCVQFGETDFDFLTRLMEEEGIGYYFVHAKEKHTLVLCDSTSGYTDCAEKVVRLNVGSDMDPTARVLDWQRELQYHSAGIELTDYNHNTPKNVYKQTVSTKNTFAQKPGENVLQDFGGYNFTLKSAPDHDFDVNTNKQLTQVRMEALEAAHDVAHGSSYCGSFFAGGRFKLDHHIASEANTYVITQVRHAASNRNDESASYHNQFSCIPDKVVFRPQQKTLKNCMRGPLTAVVTDLWASESKADADPHRMVKVKFPWLDSANSCWLRVAQLYAGAGWGASFVPRIGQEVMVDFINGDPDRPLVVGALYNKDNQGPAYTSTQSGIKTASSKFNELRFDDKKDNEEIYVEAGKNYNFLIHNDETGNILNNQVLSVTQNRTVTIKEGDEKKTLEKGNQVLVVKENQDVSIGADHKETIGGNETLTIAGNQTQAIDGDQSEEVGGKQTISIGGDHTLDVSGKQDVTISGAQKVTVSGNVKHESQGSMTLKAAQSITLQANTAIELKVGGNSIKIDPSGVTITGTMVKINGSAMTEVKGGGMLKMQGGLVMIN